MENCSACVLMKVVELYFNSLEYECTTLGKLFYYSTVCTK